jgi:hypothetical protein
MRKPVMTTVYSDCGFISVGFDVTDKLLLLELSSSKIYFFAIIQSYHAS